MTPECRAGFCTNLLRAVAAGRFGQVRLIIESGAEVNCIDECEQTPLIRAMFLENSRIQLKIVKYLLKKGANINTVDVVGRTAIHWASLRGCDTVLATLLNHAEGNFDLNRGDMNGCTALYHAATSGSAATVKLMVSALRKFDLSVDIPNSQGITPLMQALRLENDVCASVLVHQGQASLTIRDENFLNAGDWAERAIRLATATNGGQKSASSLPEIHKVGAQSKARAYRALRRNQRLVAMEMHLSSDDEDEESSRDSETAFMHQLTAGDTIDGRNSSGYDSDAGQDFSEDISSRSVSSLSSRDEDADAFSIPVSESKGKEPAKTQIKTQNDLPSIYNMYGNQLSHSYRPGYPPNLARNDDSPAPNILHGVTCPLECCGKTVSLRLPEHKVQRVAKISISARIEQRDSIQVSINFNL